MLTEPLDSNIFVSGEGHDQSGQLRIFFFTSRKVCLSDTPQYNGIVLDKVLFQQNIMIFFLSHHENICCGYSLEVPC